MKLVAENAYDDPIEANTENNCRTNNETQEEKEAKSQEIRRY